jgi:hypothetical protein
MNSRALLSFAVILGFAAVAVSQDAPRLTEADVRRAADTEIPFAELSLYKQAPPVYVASAKAWQVRYSPKTKTDLAGKKISAISVWVDDATGRVSRSR